MAINKKLIHFNKKENFSKEISQGNILPSSIVFIKDSKEIWTHGELYTCDNTDLIERIEALEQKKDNDTIYDDTELVNKINLVESKIPTIVTLSNTEFSSLVNKDPNIIYLVY